MPIKFTGIHRVTHDEDRKLEAEFWASKTIAERVIAGWALAQGDLRRQEEDEPENRTGWTLRRIARGRR